MRWITVLALLGFLAGPAAAISSQEGDVEVLDGVALTHHFVQGGATLWHYVEGGVPDGEPVILVAGLPESWFSFHHELAALSSSYRVIGLDLFGQSVRPPTASFAAADVAADIVAFADAIGLYQFNYVGHDWGTVIGDRVAGLFPHRVRRYARMELPVVLLDPTLPGGPPLEPPPQAPLFGNPVTAQQLLGAPGLFTVLPAIYGILTVQPIDPLVLTRILDEWNQPAIVPTVVGLFSTNIPVSDPAGLLAFGVESFGLPPRMDMPVLLIQGEQDPTQPLCGFLGTPGADPACTGTQPLATSRFENAPFVDLQVITGAGHFTELEQPEQVSAALLRLLDVRPPGSIRRVRDFFDEAVASGDLVGLGRRAKLARLRLTLFERMLIAAQDLLDRGRERLACVVLGRSVLRSDGNDRPPDFVGGPAADDLGRLLGDLRWTLDCH
jgi:pimeloyl-ACP methyl ester carboxylesterase